MNNFTREEMYWIWLSGVDGIFAKHFFQLQKFYLEPENVWRNANRIRKDIPDFPEKLSQNVVTAKNEEYFDKYFEALDKKDISVSTMLSQSYPYPLHSLSDPPPTIYYRGTLPEIWERSAAFVGTRRPSRNGIITAQKLSSDIAAQNILIVSGMARGIDTAAHTGALQASGKTVAVLGTGADICYPKENRELYKKIIHQGGAVVTEYKPETPPIAENFPRRNRIIAALCGALVVSEGGIKSGARITADLAAALGKQVFAIPCDIGLETSALPIMLLQSGAALLSCSGDLLSAMGWKTVRNSSAKKEKKDFSLDFLQERIYNSLLKGDCTLEQLSQEINSPINEINSALTIMEIKGAIACLPGNLFSVNR